LSLKHTKETVWAFGHPNILAIHPTTLMFTKDEHVSKNGDCIVAVAADKSVADFSTEFKKNLRKLNAKLSITIEAEGLKEKIVASGTPNLILTHPIDTVIRKSSYVCNRTLAICADKASNDLSRELIEKLKNPKQKVKLTLTVEA
jgi:uncharacterized protein